MCYSWNDVQDIWSLTAIVAVSLIAAITLLGGREGWWISKVLLIIGVTVLAWPATTSFITHGGALLTCGSVTVVAAEFNSLVLKALLGLDTAVSHATAYYATLLN